MKTIHLDLELSVHDDADPVAVADELFSALHDHLELVPDAVFSIDGMEAKR
jgi:hypothetical protein